MEITCGCPQVGLVDKLVDTKKPLFMGVFHNIHKFHKCIMDIY